MELAGGFVLLALLGVLAIRFGHDSRPGFGSVERTQAAPGPRRDAPGDNLLADELRAASRARAARANVGPGPAPVAGRGTGAKVAALARWTEGTAMPIDEIAFAQVGLRLESERTWALAAALEAAAVAAHAVPGGNREWEAVQQVLGALGASELVGLVGDLGLVTAAADDPVTAAAPDAVCDVLRHLLRDRLVDALRIAAGRPPFWTWEAIALAARREETATAA